MIPAFNTLLIPTGCHRDAQLQNKNLGLAALKILMTI
jgi:hypothetical protein